MIKNFHKPTVCVIGGDKRNEILYKLLTDDGYDTVYSDGIDDISVSLNKQCIILPLPVTRDGINLNSNKQIKLVDIISKIHPHSKVLCGGLTDDLKNKIKSTGANAIDYYNVEQVLQDNAYLTAEATLKLLIENTDSALIEKRILIIGSGRCGKALALLLNKIDCDITLSTRSSIINPLSVLEGINMVKTQQISNYIDDYDVIVNTAPSMVLDGDVLRKVKSDSVIIELASQCKGIDMSAAEGLGINAIYAPALPGKYSPYSAAKVLYNSITQIILEEFS